MKLKEVWILVLSLVLLAAFVYSAPNPSVSFTPDSLYESNTRVFNVSVNNWFGDEVIDKVVVQMPLFTVPEVVNFLGWQHNFSATEITWDDGDIETNAHSLFQYTATAGLVDEDTVVDVPVITTGDGDTTDMFQVTILNDDTPPELSNNVPSDGGFLREGRNDQPVSIDVEDPETGIYSAEFSYWDCSANITNATINIIELECEDGTCTNTIDLSDYEEGELMCFIFEVYNNAMDASTVEGTVGFDGTPPSVLLIAPEDGAYGSSSTDFVFNATDNLAPTLSCELIIDGESIDASAAISGEITTTNYDMTTVDEGEHSWLVRCTDWVELSADSETRSMIVDKTAPVITLNSPENGSMIGDGVMIDISVTDNYEVDTVDYSMSLNSSDMPEGENILVVTATDKAGNVAVAEFEFIVDRTAPTIELVSPEDNETVDVHVSFVFDADDNLDPVLDCSLYANDELITTQPVNSSTTAEINIILPINVYNWYVTCVDDTGNSETSGARMVDVTDLTGPDIISDVVTVARTEDYPFEINVTDISGVESVTVMFNGEEIAMTQDGDIYSGVIQTHINFSLGPYSLIITAVDTYGNENTLVDDFELIQGYAITLVLSPSDAETGQSVSVSGTVTLDDGGAVPEENVNLYFPESEEVVSLIDGAYSSSFTAPSTAGTYDVRAVVLADGFEHSVTEVFSVHAPAPAQSSGGGGGGGSPSIYVGTSRLCGDGQCQGGETCNNCAKDCGKCPVKKEEPKVVEEEEIVQVSRSNVTKAPEEPREPSPGVGASSGWFARVISNPWVWAIFLLILGIMYAFSSDKKKINWNGYFKR